MKQFQWILIFVIACSTLAAGQISGQFYLEKSTFAVGEPVFLYFKIANEGMKAENFDSADPYSFCSGYQVSVESVSVDPTQRSTCGPVGFAGSCLSSSALIAPGKKRVERILLNFGNEIDRPGAYSVDAQRHLTFALAGANYFSPDIPKNVLDVRTTLYFQVDAGADLNLKSLEVFVARLKSEDSSVRSEAARTLATLAPPSFEDVLLAFSDNQEFRQFAPMALYRLRTERSMKALAELLKKSEVGTYESIESASYLAKSGDFQWFPLLQEVAQKRPQIGNYVIDAAELGREAMLPTLMTLSRSPDHEFTEVNAVTGMGYTGSRAAVPILLEFLRNPNTDISTRARGGLTMLTHRTGGSDRSDDARGEYTKWAQWWAREGATAPIYKSSDCGDTTPLP